MFKTKKLHLYTSLDTIKILLFWRILKDKNILLLDFDYKDGKKYTDNQKLEIEDLWQRLYDEYFLLRDDSRSKSELDKGFRELKLKEQIVLIQEVYNTLVNIYNQSSVLPKEIIIKHEQKLYDVLKTISVKIKPKYFEGIEANLKNLERVINSLKNTYNINYKKQEKVVDNEIKNVYSVVANAQSWLAPQIIDIENMVASHWIEIEKLVAEKVKRAKKNGK